MGVDEQELRCYSMFEHLFHIWQTNNLYKLSELKGSMNMNLFCRSFTFHSVILAFIVVNVTHLLQQGNNMPEIFLPHISSLFCFLFLKLLI